MRQKLSYKLALSDILHICLLMQGKENDYRKEELYRLTFDKDERVQSTPYGYSLISTLSITNGFTPSTTT